MVPGEAIIRSMGLVRTGSRRAATAFAFLLAAPAAARTELQYQYGNFVNPFTGERHYASVLTFQNASRWSLGESFIFLDWTDDGGRVRLDEVRPAVYRVVWSLSTAASGRLRPARPLS